MSRAEHWFRWHHGTVNDPKWRVVAARASHAMSREVTPCHVLSVWAAMLECASQSRPRGFLTNWCDEDVAAGLGIEPTAVEAIRNAMQGKTLEGTKLSAWDERQPKAEDVGAARRKAESREREKSREVTQGHTESRNAATETETETETEEKQEQEQAPQRSRGSRLPTDWQPSAANLAFAEQERPEIDAKREAEKFRDHWIAKTGKDGTKKDWDATWRNWIRNARTNHDRGTHSRKLSAVERVHDNARRAITATGAPIDGECRVVRLVEDG